MDWGGICVTQMSSMEGDVEDSGDRDFLSLGTTSRSTSSAQIVGFPARQASAGAGEESMYLNMMSSLSRNGLNMLAGGANSGFSLKPPTVGNLSISPGMPSLRNLGSGAGSERTGMVSGGGFTGFYRSSVPSTRLGLPGTGLRLVSEDLKGKDEAGVYTSLREESGRFADKIELPLETDLQNLSADENLKLILKLGTRWPTWNGTTASQANRRAIDRKEEGIQERVPSGTSDAVQKEQNSLRLLASRALEALAQTPAGHYGRPTRAMSAPRQKTEEIIITKATGDAPELFPKTVEPTSTVPKQSASVALASTSSREMPAPKTPSKRPRTAALTIFYDGIVSVTDNVPADQARLIMIFAEKAGIPDNAQAPKPVTPLSGASSQPKPTPVVTPTLESEPLQEPRESNPSSVPSAPVPSGNPVEGSTSVQKPTESSDPAKTTSTELSSAPLKPIITSEGSSQPSRPDMMAKPLPTARKSSLRRFLDSRKRKSGQSSDKGPSKPAFVGIGSDAEGLKGSGKLPMSGVCSHVSVDKEGTAMCIDAAERILTDAEMKDSLAK